MPTDVTEYKTQGHIYKTTEYKSVLFLHFYLGYHTADFPAFWLLMCSSLHIDSNSIQKTCLVYNPDKYFIKYAAEIVYAMYSHPILPTSSVKSFLPV